MDLKNKAGDFYSYFKECYKLDNKEFTVTNILSRKYPHKWFVDKKEELYARRLPIVPYTNKKVRDIEKELTIYKFEKSLFYGCFFILGKNENAFIAKDKRICAPLLLFPAEIETLDEEKFLKIHHNEYIVNRNAINRLDFKNGDSSKEAFIKDFTECIESDRQNSMGIKNVFDTYFDNVNSDELALFPNVWSAAKIKKELSREFAENEYMIVPAAGTLLVEKSESSLKVLHDLEDMAKKGDFNSSLEDLLSDTSTTFETKHSVYEYRLNTDQFKGLQNSYQYPNSVIVGPPGTGKSYTITSIIADAVLNDQSILVVSKTKQAVEVMRKMLQEDFKLKNYLIHTTGHSYKVSFKAKIRKYLSGIAPRRKIGPKDADIQSLFLTLSRLESDFEKIVERELEITDLRDDDSLNLFQRWRRFFKTARNSGSEEIWNLFRTIHRVLFQLESTVNSFTMSKIRTNIQANAQIFRKELSLFYDALDSGSFTEYKKILADVDHAKIVKVFPIWLANLSELNSVLPLQKDLFDLVIIDEATQCNISSALPAIYRAKRAVVVGDPNQLRHYSFISKDQQNKLQHQYELPKDKMFDYRNKSILDVFISKVSRQDQVTFLREHFRSTPSLIEFSNVQFYEDQLEILKSTPEFTNTSQIELLQIDGVRNEKGINEKEAEAVLKKLDEIILEYEKSNTKPSIGIISPFNSQVKFINNLIKIKYELSVLKKYNILCGTPYNFQGSEREIVLMSFCVCDQSHPSAFNHVNKPEVLNVGITRARSYQYVFSSVTRNVSNRESLLQQYFHFISNFDVAQQIETVVDIFQREVKESLIENGFTKIHLGYPVAGSVLDILVTHQDKYYFIDLIGYPGRYKEAFTMERYRTLARTGITTIPLHYSYWLENKKLATEQVVAHLK